MRIQKKRKITHIRRMQIYFVLQLHLVEFPVSSPNCRGNLKRGIKCPQGITQEPTLLISSSVSWGFPSVFTPVLHCAVGLFFQRAHPKSKNRSGAEARGATRSSAPAERVGSQRRLRLQGFHCSNKKTRISLKLSYDIQFQQCEHVLADPGGYLALLCKEVALVLAPCQGAWRLQ